MKEKLTAKAQYCNLLKHWEGVVTCTIDGVVIWKDTTGIGRMNEKDAQEDAKKYMEAELERSSFVQD